MAVTVEERRKYSHGLGSPWDNGYGESLNSKL